jgi:hypothetical protein
MRWNRVRNSDRCLWAYLLLSCILTGWLAGNAHGQTFQAVTNGRITAIIGVDGQLNSVDVAGRMGVLQAGAPPRLLMNAVAGTKQSYVTIRIDGGGSGPPSTGGGGGGTGGGGTGGGGTGGGGPGGGPPPGGRSGRQAGTGWDLIFGDTGAAGKNNLATWEQPPTVVGNEIVARWRTVSDGTTATPPSIRVELRITPIRDMVCYRFTIVNFDSRAHSIGLRFVQDYQHPTGGPDGPVLLPSGAQIHSDISLLGSQVPGSWVVGDMRSQITVGGTLAPLQKIGETPTVPDRLVFGAPIAFTGANDPNLAALWDFTPDPAHSLIATGADGAAGVYFAERQYLPGESRTLITCFGTASDTVDYERPWTAGVSGPASLAFDPSVPNDPTTPQDDRLTPNPFTVTAFVHNPAGQQTLTNVTAVISLPNGLALASGQSATQSTASLAGGAETSFSWQVIATGEASGTLSYSVAFSAGPGAQGKVVARTIEIPALPTGSFVAGLQMVSFPFNFSDPDPLAALGLPLLRWEPSAGAYAPVTAIKPGEGYWLHVTRKTTLPLKGASPVNTGTANFALPLQRDWNQIGNPFQYRINWSNVMVLNTNPNDLDAFVPLPIEKASDAQHQWILPVIYRYDLTITPRDYRFDPDLNTDLVPGVGYWVKALKRDLTLLFPPSSGRSARPVSRSAPAPRPTRNNWSLRIAATAPDSADGWNFIGIAAGASDGLDIRDIEKPPAVQNGVRLGILREDWGRRAGLYAQDIQSAGGVKRWNLLVSTPTPNTDVTLSWPEIGNLPRDYELYIIDPATGQRRLMRQTSSLRINTGESASRAFTIVAEPRSAQGAFRITAVDVTPSRSASSATITFTISREANMSVRVLRSSGQVLRTLTSRAASAGPTSLTWDYRDAKGVAVPAGSYLIEVRGTTPDGENARVVVPHLLIR